MVLGAVAVDVYKKEREYKHLTLSDENVVKYLIRYRDSLISGMDYDFNRELIVLYASLDSILETINMRDREKRLLELLAIGHEMADVIEYFGYPRKTAYRTLNGIVRKVVQENDKRWRDSLDL